MIQCVGEREVGNFSVSAANLETFLTRRFPSAPTILHLHPCTPPLPFLATACAVKTTHHKSWSASWGVVSKIAHCNIAAFRRGVFGHDAVPHLSLADGTSRSTNADVPRCTWISTRVFGVPTILRTTSLACMPVTSSPFTPAIVSPTCACTSVGTEHFHASAYMLACTSAHFCARRRRVHSCKRPGTHHKAGFRGGGAVQKARHSQFSRGAAPQFDALYFRRMSTSIRNPCTVVRMSTSIRNPCTVVRMKLSLAFTVYRGGGPRGQETRVDTPHTQVSRDGRGRRP